MSMRALATAIVQEEMSQNSSSCIGSVGHNLVHRRSKEENTSIIKVFPRPTTNWHDFAFNLFRYSRPFTEEEAKVHAEIMDSMGTVVDEKVFDI